MSVNYAAGLSPYAQKGKCGQREIFDSREVINEKILKLKTIIEQSDYLVAHTGAGISTASGIPDFRGPTGVWTLEEKGLDSKTEVTFDTAQPTFTHKALCLLERKGILKFLISQNVDGLHLRSGFPRDRLSELHGNVFIEKCRHCKQEIIKENAVPTIGQKLTGNACPFLGQSGRKCSFRGKLQDIVLDWEDNLPEKDLDAAYFHSERADVSLCLGTSLQIQPAASLPLLSKRKRHKGFVVVVNLQKTKIHNKADLVIHAKVDVIMELLLEALGFDPAPLKDSLEFPRLTMKSVNGPPTPPHQKSKRPPTTRKRTKEEDFQTPEIPVKIKLDHQSESRPEQSGQENQCFTKNELKQESKEEDSGTNSENGTVFP